MLASLHTHQPKDALPVVPASFLYIVHDVLDHVILDTSRVLNFVLELDRLAKTSCPMAFAAH